jgi:hypothetical protein
MQNGASPGQGEALRGLQAVPDLAPPMAACAAASRAIGTR